MFRSLVCTVSIQYIIQGVTLQGSINRPLPSSGTETVHNKTYGVDQPIKLIIFLYGPKNHTYHLHTFEFSQHWLTRLI